MYRTPGGTKSDRSVKIQVLPLAANLISTDFLLRIAICTEDKLNISSPTTAML
jgi:hypothetical protein